MIYESAMHPMQAFILPEGQTISFPELALKQGQ
jgi:hypothetical protein